MKITAQNMLQMEIVEEVIPEPKGGAHKDLINQADAVRQALIRHMGELTRMEQAELSEDRYRKFRAIGEFTFQD